MKKILDYEQVKKAFKQNGFNFIKLEFEVNIEDNDECNNCSEGEVSCDTCYGGGNTLQIDSFGIEQEVECSDCEGSGRVTCPQCDGNWEGNSLESFHDNFISNFPSGFKTEYMDTYCDGSVNTEVTMTYSVDLLEKSEDLIRSFVKTCNECGEWDVEGAGFHISLLETSVYPSRKTLPEKKISNFVRSIDRIADAMFILSTGNGRTTRSTEYRQSGCSSIDKYTAIYTHNDTCIEYRIFDPCYDNPDRFLRFLNLMVRTLKFYSEKHYLVEKKWYRNDLEVDSSRRDRPLKDIMNRVGWRDILFKKLVYLYSDQRKLKTIENYIKNKPIKDEMILSELIK